MRIAPGTRALVAVLGIIFLGVFAYMYVQANQTETAYVFSHEMRPYEFVNDAGEDLLAITIPRNRDFEAITDPNLIVGKYVNERGATANSLVQPTQLVETLPSGQRSFPLALLPVDTYAYPIAVPSNIAGIYNQNDFIDIIALIDEDGIPSADDRGVVLFQKIRTLGLVNGQFVVALTYDQIAAYEGWQRIEGVAFTAAINQEANADFPTLYEIELYPNYEENPDIFPPRLNDPFEEQDQQNANQ